PADGPNRGRSALCDAARIFRQTPRDVEVRDVLRRCFGGLRSRLPQPFDQRGAGAIVFEKLDQILRRLVNGGRWWGRVLAQRGGDEGKKEDEDEAGNEAHGPSRRCKSLPQQDGLWRRKVKPSLRVLYGPARAPSRL